MGEKECSEKRNASSVRMQTAFRARVLLRNASIDLVMVLEAILTRRQAREKLQCLYENLMSNNFPKKGCNSLTSLHISDELKVTAVHVKMKLADNTLNNERLLRVSDKNVANRPVGCGRKSEGSYNRPFSRYPPSLRALKD